MAVIDSRGGGSDSYMAPTCVARTLVNSLNVMAGYLSVRTAGDASDKR